MAAFGRQAVGTEVAAHQDRGAEARSRAHHGVDIARALVHRADGPRIVLAQVRQGEGQAGIVVDQAGMARPGGLGEQVLAHLPVEIR